MKKKKGKKSKGSFRKEYAYFAVHKLKSVLSSVAWSMEMLSGGTFGPISQSQEEVVRRVYQEIKEILPVVNSMLDIHHIESGVSFYKSMVCDVREIVQSVIDEYQYRIKDKKIDFSFYVAPDCKIKTLANPDKIKAAVENLLNNALKYTGKGGSIKISLEEDGKKAKFQIKDSGIGIKEKEKNKVFSRFFKGSNAIAQNFISSGLGLFITKKIINDHKGKIWFESRENRGTVFYFTLPLLRGNHSRDKIEKEKKKVTQITARG